MTVWQNVSVVASKQFWAGKLGCALDIHGTSPAGGICSPKLLNSCTSARLITSELFCALFFLSIKMEHAAAVAFGAGRHQG